MLLVSKTVFACSYYTHITQQRAPWWFINFSGSASHHRSVHSVWDVCAALCNVSHIHISFINDYNISFLTFYCISWISKSFRTTTDLRSRSWKCYTLTPSLVCLLTSQTCHILICYAATCPVVIVCDAQSLKSRSINVLTYPHTAVAYDLKILVWWQ